MRIFHVLAALLLAAVPFAHASETDRRAAQVDALFAQYVQPGSPGAAVSVYQGGKVVHVRGYGLADLESGAPIAEQTQFHVASVSKQFTTFAILLLSRDGKVNLDADIRTYLPYVPDFGKPITVRHLILHSSGLRDQWDLLELGGLDESARLRQRHVERLVARQEALNFTPGTEYLYSNTGYTLLAQIVEVASGKTLRQFAQERIFGPLQMTRTFFFDDVTEVVPGRAHSYRREGEMWRKALLNYDTYGATSLFTTVGDLALWARNFSSPRVGDRALIDEISRNGTLDDGRGIRYGMGLYRTTIGGRDVVAHSGSDAAFLAIFVYYPGQDFAVSITANTSIDLTDTVAAIADIYLPTASKPAQISPATDQALDVSLAGLYVAPYERSMEIKAEDGGLYRHDRRGDRDQLRLRGDGSVDFGWPEFESFRLVKDAAGRIVALDSAATDEQSPVRYAKVTRAQPRSEDMAQYSGSYYSSELDATYQIAAAGGRLTVSSLWMPEPYTFLPLLADRFEAEGRAPVSTLVFRRGADGKVDALLMHTGRSRNLLFRRVGGDSSSNPQVARLADIDAYVEREMSRQQIPGVALTIVRDGKPVLVRGYGRANLEHDVPVHVDTVFQSGSIGKPFTAMAVMLMVEAGKLQLDQSIRAVLPEAPAEWSRITLRHLLNHTSGIAEPRVDLHRDYADAEFLQAAFSVPLVSQPGERWRYSSMGYLILGIVVSRAGGEFYGELMHERIFAPLGMRTARVISEHDLVPNRAAGYEMTDAGLKNQQWVAPSHNRTADGTLYLSALDYAQWESGLHARAVLAGSSWREILQPARLNDGTEVAYGLGWELTTDTAGAKVWSHGGGWQGFRTYFRRYERDETAFALAANLDTADPELMVDHIAALFAAP